MVLMTGRFDTNVRSTGKTSIQTLTEATGSGMDHYTFRNLGDSGTVNCHHFIRNNYYSLTSSNTHALQPMRRLLLLRPIRHRTHLQIVFLLLLERLRLDNNS